DASPVALHDVPGRTDDVHPGVTLESGQLVGAAAVLRGRAVHHRLAAGVLEDLEFFGRLGHVLEDQVVATHLLQQVLAGHGGEVLVAVGDTEPVRLDLTTDGVDLSHQADPSSSRVRPRVRRKSSWVSNQTVW